QLLAGFVRALRRAQEAAQAGAVDELDLFEVDEQLSRIRRLHGNQFALKLRGGDQVKLACERELSTSTDPGGLDPEFTTPSRPAPSEWSVHRQDYRASAGRASVGVGAEPGRPSAAPDAGRWGRHRGDVAERAHSLVA